MGSPLQDGHQILIKASGPAANAFAAALGPWGMNIDVVSATLGAGSGIKIVRSVVMKGMEALFVECALGSARHGIQDEVFASIAEFMDARPFMETVKFLLRTDVIHSERRAEEASMSADALEEVGVEPVMTRSTARVLQRSADMRLKEHFGGVVPDDYKVAVEAIDRSLRQVANASEVTDAAVLGVSPIPGVSACVSFSGPLNQNLLLEDGLGDGDIEVKRPLVPNICTAELPLG